MFLLSLLLLGGLSCVTLSQDDDIYIVQTQSGPVAGAFSNFIFRHYYYYGIPFAEPPVGKLRFKNPQPVKPWTEPVNVNSFDYKSFNACVQYYPYEYPWVYSGGNKSEDCLYLNIVVPDRENDDKKAVMFFIYGGGFNTGFRHEEQGQSGGPLAAFEDVVVVTFNYRVGIFGFLSTGTEDALGNMGLLDVLTALQWVNKNIEAFGGDKNRITVFGEDAGSIISALLTISPLAKGLFQRIILQSGVPSQFITSHVHNLNLTHETAKAVGCSPIKSLLNFETVVDCLRKKDAKYLAEKVNSLNPSSMRTFLPISGDTFLPIDPLVALKTGVFEGVDVLAGVVQDEGSIELVSEFPDLFGPYGEKDPKINKTLGRHLILKMLRSAPFKHQIARHYLSDVDKDDYDTIRERVYHAIGDYTVVCPTMYLLETFSQKKVKTYMYYFFHKTNSTNTQFHPWMGVTRYTDVPFVFGNFYANIFNAQSYKSQGDYDVTKTMMEMWANFAKTGVPSTEWKEYSRKDPYIQKFYANATETNPADNSTLEEHLKNCEFLRPYLLSS